jgi:hypothetical protein
VEPHEPGKLLIDLDALLTQKVADRPWRGVQPSRQRAFLIARFLPLVRMSPLYRQPGHPCLPVPEMGWCRQDCQAWLEDRLPHAVPRSAWVFCPYRVK